MKKRAFTATVIEGHKGVRAVIVPFDPRAEWKVEPVALDDRREGWLVAGTLDGAKLEGWIGHRWGRFFLIVDREPGNEVELVLSPTTSKTALAIAKAQAPLTTAKRRSPRGKSNR